MSLQKLASCAACSAAMAAPWSAKNNATESDRILHANQQKNRFGGSLAVLSRQARSTQDDALRKKKKKALRTAENIVQKLPAVAALGHTNSSTSKVSHRDRCVGSDGCNVACKNNLFWHTGLTVVDNVARAEHCQSCQAVLKKHSGLLPPTAPQSGTNDFSAQSLVLLSHAGLTALVQWLAEDGEQLRLENAKEYDDAIAAWLWRAEEELVFPPAAPVVDKTARQTVLRKDVHFI